MDCRARRATALRVLVEAGTLSGAELFRRTQALEERRILQKTGQYLQLHQLDLSADSADLRGWAETSGAGREAAGFGEQRTV
jgi:hypothetical protein